MAGFLRWGIAVVMVTSWIAQATVNGEPRNIELEGVDHAFAVFRYGPDRFVRKAIRAIDDHLVARGWLDEPTWSIR